ncbi:MAG: hypothetical protein AUH19_02725 [Verrucomicrobia bacterium 13_2_20CM_55_10]|nr:MAG: hypothetical protein AUH19_02725 [Verrucomicrobia bacterium 13_2_20CM_55_10]
MMKLFHSYALAKISAPFSTPSFLFSCVPDFLTRLANCLMLIGPDCGRIWANVPGRSQDEIVRITNTMVPSMSWLHP